MFEVCMFNQICSMVQMIYALNSTLAQVSMVNHLNEVTTDIRYHLIETLTMWEVMTATKVDFEHMLTCSEWFCCFYYVKQRNIVKLLMHVIDFGESQCRFLAWYTHADDLTPDIRCQLIYMVTTRQQSLHPPTYVLNMLRRWTYSGFDMYIYVQRLALCLLSFHQNGYHATSIVFQKNTTRLKHIVISTILLNLSKNETHCGGRRDLSRGSHLDEVTADMQSKWLQCENPSNFSTI